MRMFNLFKRDIKEGILKNVRIIFIPVLFWIICRDLTEMLQNIGGGVQASFAEYVLYCFAGADPIQFTHQFDNIPILWLSVPILSCYVSFDYMRRDISSVGQQTILRAGSREAWWLGKCVWTLCSTVICYVLALLTILVYCLLQGGEISMRCGGEVTLGIVSSGCFYLNDNLSLSNWQVTECVFLLPFAVLAALNMLGMLLSLIFKSTVSFILMSTYIFIAIYFINPLVIGSFGMIKNCSIFVKGGFDIDTAFVGCLLTIFASAAVGLLVFQKYNILQERSDE